MPRQTPSQLPKEPLAIIGIGCRFPGQVYTPEAYWSLLATGQEAITEIVSHREYLKHHPQWKNVPQYGGMLTEIDRFDAPFFKISPREAALMDPQQRLLLEVSWEALEHAGISPDALRNSDTGVFLGMYSHDYQWLQLKKTDATELYFKTGTSAATAVGRLSYFLGLQGPSLSIDTASSASLTAFHLACQSLWNQECHLALAAGVNLIMSAELSIVFNKAGMLSPDGRCKVFSENANGYGRGEGCGVVVVKRMADALADRDNILALVRSTAINHGGPSDGITVPNQSAQEAVIRKALRLANLGPHDISYIEAHGSGTQIGDPIEGKALQATYGKDRKDPFIVGSVKTNLGHLEAAAGTAGLIKTIMALQHKYIPPHLNFSALNPQLKDWNGYIPVSGMEWASSEVGPRRAGVSAFGLGGSNAHVILEEAPEGLHPIEPSKIDRPLHLLTLSAHTEVALKMVVQKYEDWLSKIPPTSLADMCFTTNTKRAHLEHRLSVVVESTNDLQRALSDFSNERSAPACTKGISRSKTSSNIAFLFTGQGSQYVGMGARTLLYPTDLSTFNRPMW